MRRAWDRPWRGILRRRASRVKQYWGDPAVGSPAKGAEKMRGKCPLGRNWFQPAAKSRP
jgi:hypothetical protein